MVQIGGLQLRFLVDEPDLARIKEIMLRHGLVPA